MASLAVPEASHPNAGTWAASLLRCSVPAGEGKEGSGELCNQSKDSFKISLGGHGGAALHAGTESSSAAVYNLLPSGYQSQSVITGSEISFCHRLGGASSAFRVNLEHQSSACLKHACWEQGEYFGLESSRASLDPEPW